MIIVMQPHASEAAIQTVVNMIRQHNLREHISRGIEHTIIGVVGDECILDITQIELLPEVERAIRIMHDWRMISREAWNQDTKIVIRNVVLGGGEKNILHSVSGCLNVVSHTQHLLIDPFYQNANPYAVANVLHEKDISKQLITLSQQLHQNQRLLTMRIRDSVHIQAALNAEVDVLYLGGELLQNSQVLHEVGSLNTPVILCKDVHHTVEDWLLAAERIVLRGNQHVLLCDSGTLSLHGLPNRLDVDALARVKQLSHLPLVANTSQLVHRYMDKDTLMALAYAVGVDTLIVTGN